MSRRRRGPRSGPGSNGSADNVVISGRVDGGPKPRNLAMNTVVDGGQVPPKARRRMKTSAAATKGRGGKAVKGDGGGPRMARGAGVDIRMGMPGFYQPLFQQTNMLLPRDRRERNEWCRHFYRTEPIIATALDLHTEFPISDLSNMCSDPGIKRFFDYMAFEKLDLVNFLLELGLEYWKIGDAFPFGQFNETEGIWERFTLLNPDYVNVVGSIFGGEQQIELIPDDMTATIVNNGPNGEFGDLYRQFPADVIAQVKLGRNIALDSRLVTHIAHKASQYETWGTPLMMRCFKTLIYKDKLRQAQDAIANRHIFPIRVAKIGTPGEPMPSNDDIEAFRDLLWRLEDDPNMFIVYHYGLSFEYVGSSGHILPLNNEFDFIDKDLTTGMCITPAMLAGDGSQFTNANQGFEALAHRYMAYRLRLESWVRRKVYTPISEVQGFYRPINGTGAIATKYTSEKEQRRLAIKKEMELVVPKIVWQKQDLTSNQTIMSFVQSLHDKGMVSTTTVLPLLSLDPETEKRNLERERGTVFDPEAPKTGPLPADGLEKTMHVDDGRTIREVRDDGAQVEEPSAGTSTPTGGPGLSTGNDPKDFGFPDEGPQAAADRPQFFRRLGSDEVPAHFTHSQVRAQVCGHGEGECG